MYTVGIGNIYLPELQFIASDPDRDHVFLLNSYSDAPAFVDFLSFTTCDSEPSYVTTCMHMHMHMHMCMHVDDAINVHVPSNGWTVQQWFLVGGVSHGN